MTHDLFWLRNKSVGSTVPQAHSTELDRIAKQRGCSKSKLIREAIERLLRQVEGTPCSVCGGSGTMHHSDEG